MKSLVLVTALLTTGVCLLAADGPKDDLKAAAKKLADSANYSWKSSSQNANAGGGGGGGGGQFRPGPTEGKTEKDGVTHLSVTRGDNTIVAVIKGAKGAIKTDDGWVSAEEAANSEDRQNPARMVGRLVQNYKTPAVEAAELADKATELKKDGDAIVGNLSEDAAKALMSRGGRGGGGGGPTYTGAKGSVKFWVKDGVLSKYETRVQGSVSFNGNDREVDRTTTVEIKDIGTTKIEVPDEAKKKLS